MKALSNFLVKKFGSVKLLSYLCDAKLHYRNRYRRATVRGSEILRAFFMSLHIQHTAVISFHWWLCGVYDDVVWRRDMTAVSLSLTNNQFNAKLHHRMNEPKIRRISTAKLRKVLGDLADTICASGANVSAVMTGDTFTVCLPAGTVAITLSRKGGEK